MHPNVILADFKTLLKKVIPLYIARCEKEIVSEGNIEKVVEELIYFRDELVCLHRKGELSDDVLKCGKLLV